MANKEPKPISLDSLLTSLPALSDEDFMKLKQDVEIQYEERLKTAAKKLDTLKNGK